jgi:hypothetical protein
MSTEGGPAALIQQDSTSGKLIVCQEGLDVLCPPPTNDEKKKRTPICVVAVAGLYRTGKSFLLNSLVKNLSISTSTSTNTTHFTVGKTTEACTRGIWIWDPQITICGDARLLFIDSEGLASLDQDEQHDAQIFCLALLLSSYFILNTQGVIDEAAIDRLYLVSEITKRVATTADNIKNMNQAEDYFPPLLWLLRDFHLSMEEKGRVLSKGEYLENALEDRTSSTGRRTEERNDTRRAIRKLFRRRQCYTMVRPAVDENDLRRANELKKEELRPEFVQQLHGLCQIIRTQVPKKELLGTELDGKMMVSLINKYVAALNDGSVVPELRNTWDRVVEETYQNAKMACINEYTNAMTQCTFANIIQRDDSGYRGYLERTTSSFYMAVESIHIEISKSIRTSFLLQTKGCGSTSTGERCRAKAMKGLEEAMSTVRGECVRALEETSRRVATVAFERMIEQCNTTTTNDDSTDINQTLDKITYHVDQYQQASIEAENRKDDILSFTPCGSDVMSSAWSQRMLPLLASLCSKHTTQHRIAMATRERAALAQDEQIQRMKEELMTAKQELICSRDTTSLLKTDVTRLQMKLEYTEKQLTNVQTIHDDEVAKRMQCQDDCTELTIHRKQLEIDLEKERKAHVVTQETFYGQWLERESMIDQMEIERVLDILLERVERNIFETSLKQNLLRVKEEKNEVDQKFKVMISRVAILPPIYQKRIFLRDNVAADDDFFALMDRGGDGMDDDDEPSLADGCQTQVS